jgi:hypothetical protein
MAAGCLCEVRLQPMGTLPASCVLGLGGLTMQQVHLCSSHWPHSYSRPRQFTWAVGAAHMSQLLLTLPSSSSQ